MPKRPRRDLHLERMFETRSQAWEAVGLAKQVSQTTVRRARRQAALLTPLLIGARDEPFPELLFAHAVDKRQPAAHGHLAPRLIDHHEIHEFGDAGVGGAAGTLVLRDDQIHQHGDGCVFVRGEKLRFVRF